MVVGAGPAGLAAALMLAKKGWAVSVFERSSDPAAYDPGGVEPFYHMLAPGEGVSVGR